VRKLIIAVSFVLALGSGLSAGQTVIRREEPPRPGPDVERSAVSFATSWRPQGTNGATRVVGTVIDIRQVPVSQATVQLRNLDTGAIEETSASDDEGNYAFEVEQSGTYVVEMLGVDGYVLALSNAGALSRFETLQTVVQLAGRWDSAARLMIMPQNITTFFGMSAETSMTAATVELAIDSSIPPADPGVPVSP
jgi:hypothetical protein